MKDPLLKYDRRADATIDTLDKLMALKHPNADSKALEIMNRDVPELIQHLRSRAFGPGADDGVEAFALSIYSRIMVLADKHGVTLDLKDPRKGHDE